MTLPNLDPHGSAEVLFHDIMDYVKQADAMVTARDTVSLAGLDTSIAALCKRIEGMELDAAKKYAGELETLMESIENLQAKMMALQGEVATTIKSLGKQKRASNAYNNAPSSKTDATE